MRQWKEQPFRLSKAIQELGKVDAENESIPLSAFEELVAQYHHRLLSLEADLKDAARRGAIDSKTFARRVRRLQDVHRELKAVQRLCIAETHGVSLADVGLPKLEDCTPAEKTVCEKYLVSKEAFLSEATRDASEVLTWLQDAAEGKGGALRLTLRLSKLRKLIQKVERRIELTKEHAKGMSLHLDKLLRSLNGKRDTGQSTLQGLVALFEQLNGTIARVAKLRASIKKQEEEIGRIGTWIEQQESQLRSRRPAFAPPSPLETLKVSRRIEGAIAKEICRHRKRRDLVEQFWRNVVETDDLHLLGRGTGLSTREVDS